MVNMRFNFFTAPMPDEIFFEKYPMCLFPNKNSLIYIPSPIISFPFNRFVIDLHPTYKYSVLTGFNDNLFISFNALLGDTIISKKTKNFCLFHHVCIKNLSQHSVCYLGRLQRGANV